MDPDYTATVSFTREQGRALIAAADRDPGPATTETMISRSHYTLGVAPNSDPIAAVVPVARVVSIIAVTGDLGDSAATRLLRWCEARLHLCSG